MAESPENDVRMREQLIVVNELTRKWLSDQNDLELRRELLAQIEVAKALTLRAMSDDELDVLRKSRQKH